MKLKLIEGSSPYPDSMSGFRRPWVWEGEVDLHRNLPHFTYLELVSKVESVLVPFAYRSLLHKITLTFSLSSLTKKHSVAVLFQFACSTDYLSSTHFSFKSKPANFIQRATLQYLLQSKLTPYCFHILLLFYILLKDCYWNKSFCAIILVCCHLTVEMISAIWNLSSVLLSTPEILYSLQ